MMYHYYMNGYGPEFGVFEVVWHALGIAVCVLLVIWVVRKFRCGHGGSWIGCWSAHSGLSILNERYARGEIEKAEYEERKRTLLGQ